MTTVNDKTARHAANKQMNVDRLALQAKLREVRVLSAKFKASVDAEAAYTGHAAYAEPQAAGAIDNDLAEIDRRLDGRHWTQL